MFVHGAGEVSGVWHYQVRDFAGSDAVSLPGHPQGEVCSSIEEYASWLGSYIRERNYNDVVLVGHSAGGAIILTCFLKNPERYKGLILIGSGAKFPPLHETIAVLEHRGEIVVENGAVRADKHQEMAKMKGEGGGV